MKFLTIELIRDHLRYDSPDFDHILTIYGESAESAILKYVTDELPTDDTGKTIYPAQFISAGLILVGIFDQFRNGEKEAPVDGDYLPPVVRALLSPYHCPNAI